MCTVAVVGGGVIGAGCVKKKIKKMKENQVVIASLSKNDKKTAKVKYYD